jgi:proline racemase
VDFIPPASYIGQFSQPIVTIDSHTAGEPTRLVVSGIGDIPGSTMREKRLYFSENLDHLRKRLTREPRGHRDLFTAVVTEPVSDGAGFGLIYMDARRYPFLCGHATIGAATTLIDAGMITVDEGESGIVIDTPSGPMNVGVKLKEKRVESVTLQMVPSFVYKTDQVITMPGRGRLVVELVCVGGYFAMVNIDQLDLELSPENSDELIRLGMEIIDQANSQLEVSHPERPEVGTVDVVEFYEINEDHTRPSRGIVIYGESHMDRSPCGTGTTAKMTLMHHLGHLEPGQDYLSAGPLNTEFVGRIISKTRIGSQEAVIAQVTGSAQITGFHTFVLDEKDPFPQGYLL